MVRVLVFVFSVLVSPFAPWIGAYSQERVPATITGHAILPALSFSEPPPDAPRDARTSGKFTDGLSAIETSRTIEINGVSRPFVGQPLQGFSGFAFQRGADGSLYAVIDNGFGSKKNSGDALLSFVRLKADFATGEIDTLERIWLHDPDKKVPFEISFEDSEKRYLTGADFDPEAIQVVGEFVWIGDEFGPFLVKASMTGRIIGVYHVEFRDRPVYSPDHPGAMKAPYWQVPRSGGLEGVAVTPNGNLLWAMFEKPLAAPDGTQDGNFVRALAFDPKSHRWTGKNFKLALSGDELAIGDFNFIDETMALVIERDGGQGHASEACTDTARDACFDNPARLKRVTLIDTSEIDADGFVRRVSYIDLLNIDDPDGIGRKPTKSGLSGGVYSFPFVTIEGVRRDGAEHIIVSNDNNLPFSAGRIPGVADSNEIIRLYAPELLAKRCNPTASRVPNCPNIEMP